jgi:hypothetical protein
MRSEDDVRSRPNYRGGRVIAVTTRIEDALQIWAHGQGFFIGVLWVTPAPGSQSS